MNETDKNWFDKKAEWIWSLGRVGYIPIYHSFWGALLGLPLFALFFMLGWRAYLIAYLAILALGLLVSWRSLVFYGSPKQDDRVIIDKTFGYLTAMFLAPQYSFLKMPFLWGFFIFLLIDMFKPWYVGKIHEKNGSIYIMLDDFLNGLTTCFIMWLIAAVHYLFVEPHILPAIFAR
ncbi:MAG: phosphatidylglycerophosphatase A [Deltaproteobacteria bacterium]|jgi:phosphatidylglycerophosphatase A|nr:phosphatidylglycerophosphatase A [Deltaproteobacteria bacterium]